MLGRRASFSRKLLSALLLAIISGSTRARAADCNANGIEDAEEIALREFGFVPSLEISPDLSRVTELAAADLDRDGLDDIVLARANSNAIEVLDGSPGASPGAARTVELEGRASAIAAADLDRDGDIDLAAAHGPTLSVLRNDGSGDLAPELVALSDPPLSTHAVLAGDLDGDGSTDLLLVPSPLLIPSLQVLRNLPGGFTVSTLEAPLDISGAALADLDGDSDLDIALALRGRSSGGVSRRAGAMEWLRSSGDGDFEPGPRIADGIDARLVVAADLDGDGDPDLAVAAGDRTPLGPGEFLAPHLRLFENAGDGAFREKGLHHTAANPSSLLGRDLDGDGDEDLVLLSLSRGAELFLNPGDLLEAVSGGVLAAPGTATLDAIPSTGVLGDFDGDGLLDLVTGSALRDGGPSISRGRLEPRSRDCNGNGVPDACDARAGLLDCALAGMSGDCALDCDGNGEGDGCETARGSAPDCNLNGIPDGCELPPGAPLDSEPNGIPDPCDDVGFGVLFEAAPPEETDGATGIVRARMLLESRGLAAETEGVQGWNFIISSRGCRVVEATTDGTDASTQENRLNAAESFFCDCPGGYHGALTSVLLGFQTPVTLDPRGSPHEVLKLALLPPEGADCASCFLDLVDVDDCNRCHRGQPFENLVTIAWQGVRAEHMETEVRSCRKLFHRGDANQDGVVDISDPLAMLGRNFLWDLNPFPCDDAFDADDSNAIDITDAVYLLNWLFLGGLAPPPPGPPPAPCGTDPEGLGCAAYDACGGS